MPAFAGKTALYTASY